ncbi:hypothetical protein Hanom_Chr04g00281261 [Helianthus anomalus]
METVNQNPYNISLSPDDLHLRFLISLIINLKKKHDSGSGGGGGASGSGSGGGASDNGGGAGASGSGGGCAGSTVVVPELAAVVVLRPLSIYIQRRRK